MLIFLHVLVLYLRGFVLLCMSFKMKKMIVVIGATSLYCFSVFEAGHYYNKNSSERKHKLKDGESRRHIFPLFFSFPAPIRCHHPKLIMSWKLSLRKTAELGFNSISLPLPLFFSPLCFILSPSLPSFPLFVSVKSVIPSHSIHICACL